MSLRCTMGIHDWITLGNNGKTRFEICSRCDKERTTQRRGGYQPLPPTGDVKPPPTASRQVRLGHHVRRIPE